MSKVLVLDNSYMPKGVIDVERAITLVVTNKASIVNDVSDKKIRTINKEFLFPDIIKLNRFIKGSYKRVPPSKNNIFIRDEYSCVYCGKRNIDLTLDHVIPVSKGGKNTWDNLVTACKSCNSKKGDRTPEEAEMTMIREIIKPNIFLIIKGYRRDSWNNYVMF